MTTAAPAPSVLWRQAAEEHPDDDDARRARYLELMVAAGYVVPADHPAAGPRGLPCGWTPDRE